MELHLFCTDPSISSSPNQTHLGLQVFEAAKKVFEGPLRGCGLKLLITGKQSCNDNDISYNKYQNNIFIYSPNYSASLFNLLTLLKWNIPALEINIIPVDALALNVARASARMVLSV